MRWGNCWVYALAMWWKHGGGIYVTGSIWARIVPHARYVAPGEADGLAISEFVPIKPRRDWFSRTFPFYSIWFRGRIRVGRLKGKTTMEGGNTDEQDDGGSVHQPAERDSDYRRG